MKINMIGLTFMAIHLRQGHYQTYEFIHKRDMRYKIRDMQSGRNPLCQPGWIWCHESMCGMVGMWGGGSYTTLGSGWDVIWPPLSEAHWGGGWGEGLCKFKGRYERGNSGYPFVLRLPTICPFSAATICMRLCARALVCMRASICFHACACVCALCPVTRAYVYEDTDTISL